MWVYAVARPADENIDLPPVEKSAVYWFLQHIRRHSALIPASYPAQYPANFRNKCCTISVTLPEQMPEAQSGTIWHQQHLFISGTISGARSGIINIYYPAKYKYFPASKPASKPALVRYQIRQHIRRHQLIISGIIISGIKPALVRYQIRQHIRRHQLIISGIIISGIISGINSEQIRRIVQKLDSEYRVSIEF